MMNPPLITEINLENCLEEAKQETLAMILQGIDISDRSVVTPLEWTANQYPEIAERCNQCLMELMTEQPKMMDDQASSEIINEF